MSKTEPIYSSDHEAWLRGEFDAHDAEEHDERFPDGYRRRNVTVCVAGPDPWLEYDHSIESVF